ncbi:MAG: class I SAM-dependent methyltransferase [Deltaproteobacteria bacterium]|nr:class I SAM-dependent methyltransferase [Myxococcales bacterium]MDP3217657.1 class I SAM-dependent methyltransferase [Deltaproteobacteria bacterium]
MKPLLRACPICRGDRGEVLHTQQFDLPDDDPLPREYDVVACATCGFAFADTPAPQSTYDAYYAARSKYEDRTVGTGGGDNPFDRDRLESLAGFLAAHVPWRDRPVLDLGCANGGLLQGLSRHGFTRLVGVDPSPGCAANVRALGFDGHVGGLFAGAGLGRFGLVSLTHVLEHVRDLDAATGALRSLVDDDGLLYVETPDAAGYAGCLRAPFQDFNTEHINHFTRRSLEGLLGAAGFAPVASGEKVFDAAPDVPIPAVFTLARRVASPSVAAPAYDQAAVDRVREYVARSSAELRRIDALIAPHLDGPIQVWGTGQLLFKLLHDTSLGRARVVAWLDNNPKLQGSMLRGVRVLRPADAVPGVPILIASTLHGPAIAAAARALGLDNPIIQLGAAAPRG